MEYFCPLVRHTHTLAMPLFLSPCYDNNKGKKPSHWFVLFDRNFSLSMREERSCEGDTATWKVTWCRWLCVCVCACVRICVSLSTSYWRWTQSIVSPACLTCRRRLTSLTSTGTPCTRRRWMQDLFLMWVWSDHISTHTNVYTPIQ